MRLNIYSQELITDTDPPVTVVEGGDKGSHTEATYSFVRQYLLSAPGLHDRPGDDDRSAITWWLPKSQARREVLARQFEALAAAVRRAPAETGLDD